MRAREQLLMSNFNPWLFLYSAASFWGDMKSKLQYIRGILYFAVCTSKVTLHHKKLTYFQNFEVLKILKKDIKFKFDIVLVITYAKNSVTQKMIASQVN